MSPELGGFPARLWLARAAANMSQAELARASSHNPAAISHYERGERRPSLRNLRRLVQALGCGADYLLATRRCDKGCAR